MGRPAKLTPEVEARILRAIRLGATREVAAQAAGISERALYDWLERGRTGQRRYLQFLQAMDRAESEGEVTHLEAIAADGAAGSKWILARRHPDRWSETVKQESSGEVKIVVEYINDPVAAPPAPSGAGGDTAAG